MIRIDAAWLATTPLDMRAGTDTALARVIATFGAARPHHAYVFANQRANRLKVLVHDGVGLWLAACRLRDQWLHALPELIRHFPRVGMDLGHLSVLHRVKFGSARILLNLRINP